MKATKLLGVMMLGLTLIAGSQLAAQVQTEVPPVVPGAKPVTVQHIQIHGQALEGNLEGDAVDRDVIVFLPPSYAKKKSRRYPVVYALHGFPSAPSNGRTKSMSRKRSKAPSPRARKK